MGKVLFEQRDGVGVLKINRAKIRNAIDYEVMDEMARIINETKDDPQIKILVVTGDGQEAFCSGGDLSCFHSLHTTEEAYVMLSKMGTILYDLFNYPKPTFALLNGTAVGGGAELAVACDFRYAASHAKIGFIQGNLGITTGWGGSAFLYERLPRSLALELLLSGKKLTAKEAQSIGLVKDIGESVSLETSFYDTISSTLAKSSQVLSANKQNFLRSIDTKRLKEKINEEIQLCAVLWDSEEHHQAVSSFLTRR